MILELKEFSIWKFSDTTQFEKATDLFGQNFPSISYVKAVKAVINK
jgi:hypothetical protein